MFNVKDPLTEKNSMYQKEALSRKLSSCFPHAIIRYVLGIYHITVFWTEILLPVSTFLESLTEMAVTYQTLRRVGVGSQGAASPWCHLSVVLRIGEDEGLAKARLLWSFKGAGFWSLAGRNRLLQQGHQINTGQTKSKQEKQFASKPYKEMNLKSEPKINLY